MSETTDNVNHPEHYTRGFACRPVECIDITRHLDFTLGNAFKYIWRAGKKGDFDKAMEDLDKAEWYLEDRTLKESQPENPELRTARALFDLLEFQDGSLVERRRHNVLWILLHLPQEAARVEIEALREAMNFEKDRGSEGI